MTAADAPLPPSPRLADPPAFRRALLKEARRHGFELAGIAAATPAETGDAFRQWLNDGRAGEMAYLARGPERRIDPALVWPDAASILVVGISYLQEAAPAGPGRGRVARYALGDDYHEVIEAKLRALLAWAEATIGIGLRGRCYVDAGPLLERDLAARAGMGWFGKNSMLLNRRHGSYFFLGALLLNVALPPTGATTAHCGSCRRCLAACPTGAFVAPYVLDARRCISYLTIELKGPIPRELRPLIGDWIFGCDVCQEVCPWNRAAEPSAEPRFAPRPGLVGAELTALLRLNQEEFSLLFRGSPVKRAKRRGLLRNICVALGNQGDPAAVPALAEALGHEEPLVRGHAAWALGSIGGEPAVSALRARLPEEADVWVRDEIELALAAIAP